MYLLFRIILILCIAFKATSGYSAANPITDIIINNNQSDNHPLVKIRSIVDRDSKEQEIAKYYKLSDILANPQENKTVLIRGSLAQSLNNNDLFVFKDDTSVANIIIATELWSSIKEKTYTLNKNLQFLAIVVVNKDTKSISLQVIKIFLKISDTDNYILSAIDKKNIAEIKTENNKKLSTKTISYKTGSKLVLNTKESQNSSIEDDFDSIEDYQNKPSTNPYGVSTTSKKVEEKKSPSKPAPVKLEQQTKNVANKEPKAIVNKPTNTTNNNNPNKKQAKKEKIVEEEPEIYNKVPNEEHLKYKEMSSEDNNVLTPEEIQKLEKYDKSHPPKVEKKGFLNFMR